MEIFAAKKWDQARWKIRRTRVAAQQTVKTFMTGFFKTLSVHRLYCIQSLFFFAPMTFGHSAATADAVKMSWKYAAAAKQQQKLRWTLDQKQRSIFCLHLIRITHFTHKNTHERCASTFLPFPAAAATEKRDWKVRTVRFLLNTCLMFMAYKIQSDEICVHVCVWVGGCVRRTMVLNNSQRTFTGIGAPRQYTATPVIEH